MHLLSQSNALTLLTESRPWGWLSVNTWGMSAQSSGIFYCTSGSCAYSPLWILPQALMTSCMSWLSRFNPRPQRALERPQVWHVDRCRAIPGSWKLFHSALAGPSDHSDPAAGPLREFPIYSPESPALPTVLKDLVVSEQLPGDHFGYMVIPLCSGDTWCPIC